MIGLSFLTSYESDVSLDTVIVIIKAGYLVLRTVPRALVIVFQITFAI